jgi:enoyl-CoA hydratase/carnithine racemase
MAMPETNIGLFPDVGGGYFLSRCPGRVGEYLALTGATISGADAVAVGLADMEMASTELPALWESLAREGAGAVPSAKAAAGSSLARHRAAIDHVFALQGVAEIVGALEAGTTAWSRDTAALLRRRSPLMLHVALEQVRRGRGMSLADTLRMERDLVHRCFHLRPGTASETVEGIRALAVDKDNVPRWNPPCVEAVTQEMVAAFFHSPWPAHAHPLRGLA